MHHPENTTLFSPLLPRSIVSAELLGDSPVARPLRQEASAIGRASEKRWLDFARGRHCARQALATFGIEVAPIPIGDHREPIWPAGFVGSITHCAGYCAAAVGQDREHAAIGIDAETHAALPNGALEIVSLPSEREWLVAQASLGLFWDRILFSAKESVFKAWYPMARKRLDFHDVRIVFTPEGLFEAEITVEGPFAALRGGFRVTQGLVITAVRQPACGGEPSMHEE
jgi:4'-phosphopantetheinyl transferase EntD